MNANTITLEDYLAMLQNAKDGIVQMHKEFLEDEFAVFAAKAAKHTPVNTGAMAGSYRAGEVRQEGPTTEVNWTNTAEYASFVNDGTVHIAPHFFWERSENEARQGREVRYQQKFKQLFKAGD